MNGASCPFGRRVIRYPAEKVDRSNILDILQYAKSIHAENQAEIEYLYWYYRGKQPVLNKTKAIRPEINNIVLENHAYEIVTFKLSYDFSDPVQYVRKSSVREHGQQEAMTPEEAQSSESVAMLNEWMDEDDKAEKDRALAEWFYICGTAYKQIMPAVDDSGAPFATEVLDPRNTFVVYSTEFGGKPLMAVKIVSVKAGIPTELYKKYCIYTEDAYYELDGDLITKEAGHILGYVPIIEYPANSIRIGAFELVLTLLDQLNNASSARMDSVEQFVQSFMKFVNCDIDEETFSSLKELGAIKVKSEPGNPADVQIVSSELNQTQVQTVVDDLYDTILTICGMPGRDGASKTTGDTGQAVVLRDGWSAAEARAKAVESIFKRSEKQFLRIALAIIQDTPWVENFDLALKDIDIKFTRNKTDNLLVKTQGLQNLLTAGVHPRIALQQCNLFSDSEEVYLESVPYLEKWLPQQAAEVPKKNTETPEDPGEDDQAVTGADASA